MRRARNRGMSYSSIIYGNTLRAAVNATLTICLGPRRASGEASLGHLTLTTTHTDRELPGMRVIHGNTGFKVTQKVADLYYLVDSSYYGTALRL